MVTVAAIQLRVDDAEPSESRIDRVTELVRALTPMPDVVVLPELWPVGAFNVGRLLAQAEPLDGQFTQAMADLARSCATTLHAGSFPELRVGLPDDPAERAVSNTSVVFSPEGRLLAHYRKIHLFGFDGGEAAAVSAGDELVAFPSPLGSAGLATCYDLRFPGLFRQLSAAGAEAFLIPSGWPEARIGHWSLLARARALENQAVLVGCNAVGTNGGVRMGGASVIVGPTGDVVAQAGADERVLVASIDPAEIQSVRRSFPVLLDRRLD